MPVWADGQWMDRPFHTDASTHQKKSGGGTRGLVTRKKTDEPTWYMIGYRDKLFNQQTVTAYTFPFSPLDQNTYQQPI